MTSKTMFAAAALCVCASAAALVVIALVPLTAAGVTAVWQSDAPSVVDVTDSPDDLRRPRLRPANWLQPRESYVMDSGVNDGALRETKRGGPPVSLVQLKGGENAVREAARAANCPTCPRRAVYLQPSPVYPSQHIHVPSYQVRQPTPVYRYPTGMPAPAWMNLPPGSRVISVTETRPYQPTYQSWHDPLNEPKTGAYTCPRCRRSALGGEMKQVDIDGTSVPVLCDRCWAASTAGERAAYVSSQMQKQQ